MKNWKIIIICFLALSMLGGCKSVDSLLKKEEYKEAYELANTSEEKEKVLNCMFDQEKYNEAYSMSDSIEFKTIVVDYMIKKNKYEDAMHLLSDEYKNTEDKDLKENLLDLFLGRVKIEADVDQDYGSIAWQAYYKIKDSTDYEKQWTLLCMNGTNIHQKKFLDELINKKGFVNLTTYSSNSSYSQYKWVRKTLKYRIEQFLRSEYYASTKKEEKKKQLNALNQITDILIKYGTSNYEDDRDCGKTGNYYYESVPLVDIVINDKKHFIFDDYGKVESRNCNFTLGGGSKDLMLEMLLYNSDRNNIMYKPSVVPNANYWAYQSMNNKIFVYFENITNKDFVRSLIDSMKKDYQ